MSHVIEQVLATHTALPWSGTLQRFPHPPQLAESVAVFTQAPEQAVSGGTQEKPHTDWVHVAMPPDGAVQTVPQPPQSVVEVVVSTQDPLQFVRVPAHVPVHLPAEHTWPPHEVVQVPQ